ncbi:hypothetical protein BDN72DRAFT_881753 [Pluteus cervinus]|uniref:Uncharacterized protein n=1 Tax=Pluteus cervinus TaxID=181527 RepID=A0ACD3AEC4_9AGAR|nr:hypothetical protein BDN72DRAFT_881753 [Pluteus cervinus]
MTVKLIAFIRHKHTIAFGHFDRHWVDPHGRLVQQLTPVKEGRVTYTQFHIDPTLVRALGGALPVADVAGLAIFTAERLETILEMFASKEYQEKVAVDEERLGFDRASVQIMVGYDHVPAGSVTGEVLLDALVPGGTGQNLKQTDQPAAERTGYSSRPGSPAVPRRL